MKGKKAEHTHNLVVQRTSLADLLLITVIGEAYKRELVAHKGLWYGKGLLLSPILLNVIKVTGVSVTAKFGDYRGSRCTQQRRQQRVGGGGAKGGEHTKFYYT